MRLEMSSHTDIAIRAMRELSRGDRIGGAGLAATIGTTPTYLARILAPLVRAGWITSKQGPSGGYTLVADLHEVTVLDVIAAVEGPIDAGRCVLRNTTCSADAPCSMHGAWSRARDALTKELAATSVATCIPRRSTAQ